MLYYFGVRNAQSQGIANMTDAAVTAIGHQFTSRLNEVIDGVMEHLTDANAKDILGPALSPLIGHGSLKCIVTFAIYADVLRVLRDMTIADGKISDEEIQEGLGLLAVLAASFAKVRKDAYAAYADLSISNARDFLTHYDADSGLFGYRNDATRWAGRQLCRSIEMRFNDSQPLTRFNTALLEWAKAIASSDGKSPADKAMLESLATVLSVSVSQHAAPRAAPMATPAAPEAVRAKASTASVESVPVQSCGHPPGGREKPQKSCPYCGETILAVAIKCRYCGEMLSATSGQRSVIATAGTDTTSGTAAGDVPILYDATTKLFSGARLPLVRLAMRAIQDMGWTLGSVNEEMGLVTFETGMSWGSFSGVTCTLMIEEASQGRYRVTGTGKQNVRGGQWLAPNLFGEANKKAQRAIDRMKKLAGYDFKSEEIGKADNVRRIWGNTIIVFGVLFALNALTALGSFSVGGFVGGLVLLGFGGSVVYLGLRLRRSPLQPLVGPDD